MKIKGEYRDVLSRNGEVIADTGWKSNTIVEDYGRFLAALMKKDFKEQVGIEYMAVGSGSDNDSAVFKGKAVEFFNWLNEGNLGPLKGADYWAWAKKIDVGKIKYRDDQGKVTNKLEMEVIVEKKEPSEETLVFKEFALLGIDKNSDGTFDTNKMFFINYVEHGPIAKDKDMELTRDIKLTFPIEEKEEEVS